MTTFAPNQDLREKLEELEERTRLAWEHYSESLRELAGRDYEEAEDHSWERLQRDLRQLEDERAELTGREPRPGTPAA